MSTEEKVGFFARFFRKNGGVAKADAVAKPEVIEGLSQGILVNEDGSYTIPKADGSGDAVVTVEDLEKGMVTFGKEMSMDELLHGAGANLRDPCSTAIREFYAANDENKHLINSSSRIYYSAHRVAPTKVNQKNEAGELEVVIIDVEHPEEMVCEDRYGQKVNTEASNKLVRRLNNYITTTIMQEINEEIISFEIVRASIADGGLTTITVRRNEVSSYSFLLRI